ncbi:GtrA family protein [Clostridium sartagoforme]|uniref:GtrA family protein n=1 Tax=Clostridium sartagoforme TaxID=84031 RepID=UPI003BF9DCDF
MFSNGCPFLFEMINSYLWNNIWVFKAKSKEIITTFKFIVINLVTLFINNILRLILVDNLNFNASLSRIVSIIFTMSINFLGNKL